jgi:hypothetical protein
MAEAGVVAVGAAVADGLVCGVFSEGGEEI